MKIIPSILNFMAPVALFVSCSDPENSSPLSGKVYQSSDGMDSSCNHIPKPTDYFQTLLFLNDSDFVHIVNTCCSSPGEDFAYQYVGRGIYELNDKTLDLSFDSVTAVCYIREPSLDPGDNSSAATEHIELEVMAPFTDRLERLSCKNVIYFKQLEGEFKDEFVAPTSDSLEKYVRELKSAGAWKELFPSGELIQ
jgi:hypothetical protein